MAQFIVEFAGVTVRGRTLSAALSANHGVRNISYTVPRTLQAPLNSGSDGQINLTCSEISSMTVLPMMRRGAGVNVVRVTVCNRGYHRRGGVAAVSPLWPLLFCASISLVARPAGRPTSGDRTWNVEHARTSAQVLARRNGKSTQCDVFAQRCLCYKKKCR